LEPPEVGMVHQRFMAESMKRGWNHYGHLEKHMATP